MSIAHLSPDPGPPDVVSAAAALVREHGVTRAARILDISRNACIALAGGLPVQRGTVAVARESLVRLATPRTGTGG